MLSEGCFHSHYNYTVRMKGRSMASQTVVVRLYIVYILDQSAVPNCMLKALLSTLYTNRYANDYRSISLIISISYQDEYYIYEAVVSHVSWILHYTTSRLKYIGQWVSEY